MAHESIPAHRAAELLSPDTQIIDVREPHEVRSGMLPGAQNIPVGELEHHLHRLSPGRPVAVICASGGRSLAAAELLVRRGFPRVVDLAGGMQATRAAATR
jgi:rhodanese-related sulfurtransferase